jgi:Skp family chaperone for outer membrane proteins
MQIIARRIFFLIVVFAAIPAMAGKVGFLDTERAIKTVKEGQRQMQVLDVWANQRADEVEKMRDQVTEITERLNAQRTIATEDVLRELENELLQAQRELEDAARARGGDSGARHNR